jgi:hypothetical protein
VEIGDLEEAVEDFDYILRFYPSYADADLYRTLATLYLQLDELAPIQWRKT